MSIFLYGTLLYDPLFTLVSGAGAESHAASLAGYGVAAAPNGPWPALVPRAGATARGRLLTGLTPAQEARLDRYELPFGYTRAPVTVQTAEGPAAATVYLPPPGTTGAADWSLDRWIRDHAPAALAAAAEVDWGAAGFDAARLRREWPMIRVRAAARIRAGQEPTPATLRHAPRAGDWSVTPAAPSHGSFFRLATSRMGHARFAGGRHDGLLREVMVGADAALVLPYDPVRDRVALIEQFRAGPAQRGDGNPWTLEPIAGIVDPDETPETAARREAAEEAGLTIADLIPMFHVYATPGNATDHFYCFLGLADLPDGLPTLGGLESEAEDLRLHVLAFDRAMDLLDTGEVTAAPLAAMLLWLFRRRAARP
jgi:ADP-ribose pyrophosphatase